MSVKGTLEYDSGLAQLPFISLGFLQKNLPVYCTLKLILPEFSMVEFITLQSNNGKYK